MVRGSSSSSGSKSSTASWPASGRVAALPRRPPSGASRRPGDYPKGVRRARAPLDHCHGVVHGVFKVDVVDFRGGGKPVSINVDQIGTTRPRPVRQVRVDTYQDKRGRDDAGTDAQSFAESLGEGGLASTKFACQDQQVTGLKDPASAEPKACVRSAVATLTVRSHKASLNGVLSIEARSPGIRPGVSLI
ncbi:hypothetical protein AHiyo8_51760 [Arthrobacter sp. Hiyo8]|nr:hypothetical protein AHiyo8_51760 [Arthrobacter sp. Hiyo8]